MHRIETEEQERLQEKRNFMARLEGNGDTLPWKCGIFDHTSSKAHHVFASANTEEEAERYMMLRAEQNGGVIPHRLVQQEVGWWYDEKDLTTEEN